MFPRWEVPKLDLSVVDICSSCVSKRERRLCAILYKVTLGAVRGDHDIVVEILGGLDRLVELCLIA